MHKDIYQSRTNRSFVTFFAIICVSYISPCIEASQANNSLANYDFVSNKGRRMDSLRLAGLFPNAQHPNMSLDESRERFTIGIKANFGSLSFPQTIKQLSITPNYRPGLTENIVLSDFLTSITLSNGDILTSDIASAFDQVHIDRSLVSKLIEIHAVSIRRVFDWQPGRTFSFIRYDGTPVTRDLSMYYYIRFDDSTFTPEAIKTLLETSTSVESAYTVGIPIDFDIIGPPPPSRDRCQYSDEYSYNQWYLMEPDSGGIDVYGAWHLICDSLSEVEGPLIGIEDSKYGNPNVDSTFHPDLLPNIHSDTRINWSNMRIGVHGSNVAGIIAAAAGNISSDPQPTGADPSIIQGIGITGIAPHSKMILTSHSDSGTEMDFPRTMENLHYMIDSTEVRIINMSWGITPPQPDFEDLLDYAFYEKEILLVAAAGNKYEDFPDDPIVALPGSHPTVIAVGAWSRSGSCIYCDSLNVCDTIPGSLWYLSNPGYVDYIAPGAMIYTTGGVTGFDGEGVAPECDTCSYHGYSFVSGTSASSALVTATAALIMTAYPEISMYSIANVLKQSTSQISCYGGGYNNTTGWGLVNAQRAVAIVRNGLYCDTWAGDVNSDCYVNNGDLNYLETYLFAGGPAPPNSDLADVDSSCTINVSDLTYLTAYIFLNGTPPLMGCAESGGVGKLTLGNNNSNPLTFQLEQNYPNPFNPTTSITFSLPHAQDVHLDIYNMLGRKVVTLVDDYLGAGSHTFSWDSRSFASGVYVYRISTEDFVDSKKMILLK